MCRIAGGIRKNRNFSLKEKEFLFSLFLQGGYGNSSAQGFFLWNMKKGIYMIQKQAGNIASFISQKKNIDLFFDFPFSCCLLHNRLATQGTPMKNENNHPLQSGNIVLIHNGQVENSFFPVVREVDSFQLVQAIQQDQIEKIIGMVNMAYVDLEKETLSLFSNFGKICFLERENSFFFFQEENFAFQYKKEKEEVRELPFNTLFDIHISSFYTISRPVKIPLVEKKKYTSWKIWDAHKKIWENAEEVRSGECYWQYL